MRQRYIILQYVLWNRKNFHWLQRNKRSIQTLRLIILRCDGSGIECKIHCRFRMKIWSSTSDFAIKFGVALQIFTHYICLFYGHCSTLWKHYLVVPQSFEEITYWPHFHSIKHSWMLLHRHNK